MSSTKGTIFYKCFTDASYRYDTEDIRYNFYSVGHVIVKENPKVDYMIKKQKYIFHKKFLNEETKEVIGRINNHRMAEFIGIYTEMYADSEKEKEKIKYFYIHNDCLPILFTIKAFFYECLRNYMKSKKLPNEDDYKVYVQLFIDEVMLFQNSQTRRIFDVKDEKQKNIIEYLLKKIQELFVKILETKNMLRIEFIYTPAHFEEEINRKHIFPIYIPNYFLHDVHVDSSPSSLFFNFLADDVADINRFARRILNVDYKSKVINSIEFTLSRDELYILCQKILALNNFRTQRKIRAKVQAAEEAEKRKHLLKVASHIS